jgi:D-xylose 1-dehydrogenase (NADP+, D-xylono-1,5-lactone-forming)
MKSHQKLRWGVLGYARIAREFVIPALRRSSNGEFFALASRDEAKLAECRTRYADVAKTFRSYEELVRDPEIDAVYIPLPNSLHREWTLKAAAHGKHVLCEKPMALNTAECREMIVAAETHRVTLMEAFMYRYTTRTQRVLEVLRSGVLGEIKQVNSCFRFLLANPASIKLRPELGGGALYDVGCYPINFIGLVVDSIAGGAPGAGGQPETVQAVAESPAGVDLNFAAALRYRSGLLATVQCGFNAHQRVYSEIVGTTGVLEIPDTFFDVAGALTLITAEGRREIDVPACDRYRLEVEDFAEAARQARAPQFSLTETLRNAEVLDRLRAAIA